MITLEDCKAFCDAPSSRVEELACRECLSMVQAYARAHEMAQHHDCRDPGQDLGVAPSSPSRDAFKLRRSKVYPLRAYPANSAHAMARLTVMAILADGRLDTRELATLERRDAFAELAISREEFVQVLHDFCTDVARLSTGAGGYRLSPTLLSALFGEIDDPLVMERVLELIVAVISSDGVVEEGEDKLLMGALHAWGGSLRHRRLREGNAVARSLRG